MNKTSANCQVDEVIITGELDRRPSRAPDHQAESRALTFLAETMSTKPDMVLQRLVELTIELTHSDSAGISLLEPGGELGTFRWVATAGAWAPYRDGTMPREQSPCGEVIAREAVLLVKHPERVWPALLQADPGISEGLLAPFHIDGVPVGTVWTIKHKQHAQFDAEDARVLKSLARFASAAQQMVLARRGAEAGRRESEQKFRNLFNSIDEGFVEMELVMGDAGQVVDWRWLDFNPAFERMSGLEGKKGKFFSEVVPDLEPEWAERYGHVVSTGKALRFESPIGALGKWFEVFVSRIGGEGSCRLAVIFNDITDRKRAEFALRESEARLAVLLNLSDSLRPLTDPIDIIGQATHILGEYMQADRTFIAMMEPDGVNLDVYNEYLRPGASSVIGHHNFNQFGAFVSPELVAGHIMAVEDVAMLTLTEAERAHYAAVGIAAYLLVPLVRDGRFAACFTCNHQTPRAWTEADKNMVRQTADRTWAAVERARVEVALHDSEERFRQFGEASQDVLWMRDAETFQWEYLTPAFETIYGLDRETALRGDNMARWLELIVPDDREHAAASLNRVRDGEWVTFEYRVRRPVDGQIRWLRNTDFPIRDATGEVARIGGIGHDITELKRVEEALAAAEVRQRILMEGIPQLVWRSCDEGLWTWASAQWLDFTGQSQAESCGRGWLDVVHPDDRAAALRAWDEALPHGMLDIEYRVRRAADGAWVWHHTRSVPVRDGDGRITEWLGTSTDIQNLRELQDQQHVLVAELQHRTRNLMGVVRSLSDKTARASTDLADFRNRFRDRLDALARVQGLLSRLNEHDRVTFEELIEDELTAMDGAAERVSLVGPKGVRLRSSMVQMLAMALHELATNAVKYGAIGQPQGSLEVSWSEEEDGPGQRPWLHIDWRESGVTMPPAGSRPTGGGQGRELIERALPYQLSAKTTYELGPDGVHCTISIPVSATASSRETEHA